MDAGGERDGRRKRDKRVGEREGSEGVRDGDSR